MNINWQSGFKRAWLVLSLVWVFIVIASSYEGVIADFKEQSTMSEEKVRLEQNKDTDESQHHPRDLLAERGISAEPSEPSKGKRLEWLAPKVKEENPYAEYAPDYPHPWQKVSDAVLFAVLPPIGSLVLWFSGVWVWAGFRSKK